MTFELFQLIIYGFKLFLVLSVIHLSFLLVTGVLIFYHQIEAFYLILKIRHFDFKFFPS